ncbi:MAG: response regulator [Bacteroidota bacterium]|nr:response regulator [Bacteroidota bacterium]
MKNKILIIEDEIQLARNISILLKAENYDVRTSSNGTEGLESALNWLPDLIICDIMMPGMDGYAVFEALQKNITTSAIPFIYLTAKVERSDLRKGMELGADDYIFKPFSAEELIKAVSIRLQKFQKVKAKILTEQTDASGNVLSKKYKPEDKMFFKLHNSSILVLIEEIKCILSENQYSNIITAGNKSILVRRAISTWEKMLPEKMFIRIHRSTIINLKFILKIEKCSSGSYRVYLKDQQKYFDISRKYIKKLKNYF